MAGAVQQGPGTTVEERHRLPVKTLVSASIGNAVEWFDWTVYATFVVFFAGQVLHVALRGGAADRGDGDQVPQPGDRPGLVDSGQHARLDGGEVGHGRSLARVREGPKSPTPARVTALRRG